MVTILNETKSSGGSPYAYYQVNATASDRTTNSVKVNVQVIGRLSSSGASLGTGSTMGLIGYITLYGTEYSITLKSTSENWSGTTKHTSSREITVPNIPSTLEQLTNIKFRVSRTGSAANDYTRGAAMSSKTCSNLTIGIGHTPPSDITYSITEKNPKLINAGVGNTTYVNMLSIKEYNISATTYDGATITEYNIYNGVIPSFRKVNPFEVDYSVKELTTWQETGKVPIRAQVIDSMGGYVNSSIPLNPDLYDYIPYIKVILNETTTNVKRVGQTSGRARLNINGTFYNGSVGNVYQEKPIIKYKFWKYGESEPDTFNNVISSDNIEVNGNSFSITDYQIGSPLEGASNYFNPDYAYRVKVYVEDNFTNYTSQEKPIPVGESTWTEYKDRVDFKKITIKNKNEFFYEPGDTFVNTETIILYGYVTSGSTAVRLYFPMPKRLDNITSIIVQSFKGEMRGGKGYLNSQSGDVEYVGKSGYALNLYKSNGINIYAALDKSSAYTNVDNNTPVIFVIYPGNLKLTFN